jgi:outer membrane biosynthesis protein TonB
MSREAGLELLATAVSLSVPEIEQMNPILYVRRYLNEFPEDAIELLIKLCQMFGPYSYKLMAAQLTLEPILEVSEPPSPEKTEEPIPTEESITDALEEPEPEPELEKPEPEKPEPEKPEPEKPEPEKPEPEKPEPEPEPEPEPAPEPVKPTLQPLVRCGCWGW